MVRVAGKTLEAVGKTRGAYCQIVGAEISAHACLTTQGQSGCFGCASPYRFCELCGNHLVMVAAVGLCNSCLEMEVVKEKRTGKPSFPSDFKVECQLLSRKIKPAMCEATQGQEGCCGCAAPSRLCEKCKERAIRFPRYGFCLRCSVEELGNDERQPVTSEEGRLREIRAKLSSKPEVALREEDKPVTSERVGVEPVREETSLPSTQVDESHPQSARESRKIRVDRGRIIVTLVAKRPDHFNPIVDLAERLVRRHNRASALFLQGKLGVTYGVAKKVLRSLEERGVIGPPQGTGPREVIRKAERRVRYPEEEGVDVGRLVLKALYELSENGTRLTKNLYIGEIAAFLAERYSGDFLRAITPHWVRHIIRKQLGLETDRRNNMYVVAPRSMIGMSRLFSKFGLAGNDADKQPNSASSSKPKPNKSRTRCRLCEELVYSQPLGLCKQHAFRYYGQKQAERTTHGEDWRSRAEVVLPEARVAIQKMGVISRQYLKSAFRVGNEVAGQILQLLEEEGLIGASIHGRSRKLISDRVKISCCVCGQVAHVKSRRLCRKHYFWIYWTTHTRHFLQKDGRSKAEKLLPIARDVLLEKGEVSGLLLRRALGISERTAKGIIILLEAEGLITKSPKSTSSKLILGQEGK